MKKYILILSTLVFSLLGTLMTQFCLAIWITKNYESTLVYTLVVFFGTAPPILLSPIIGSYVDRWNKRKTIIIANSVAGFTSLGLIIIYTSGNLEPWILMIFAFIGSVADRFMSMAFNVSTIGLVTRERLSQARGYLQSSVAIVMLTSPILAPFLLEIIGLTGVFYFEMGAFVLTVIVMQFIEMDVPTEKTKQIHFKKDAKIVFDFFRSRKGLIELMIYDFLGIFMIGSISIMMAPLLLDFSNEKWLGIIMALGGVGMLIGGLSVSFWRGFRRPIVTSIYVNILISILLFIIVIKFNIYVIAGAVAGIMLCNSIIKTIDGTFWLAIIPETLQGRVLGYRILIVGIATPIAYLTSGVLIDYAIQPMLENMDFQLDYPGSVKTTAIIVLLGFAAFGNLLVSLVFRKRKSVHHLDLLFQEHQYNTKDNIEN